MRVTEGEMPINIQFPDQFSIGNSNHDPSKVNIDFDDLIIEGLQLEESQKIKNKRKWSAAGPRKDLQHQRNINFKMRTIIKLMRKQETLNKKIMRLLREMVEYNTFNLE